MKQFTATANDDGVRLSRFVQSVTRDLPTSLLYKSFRNKRVKVNGKKAAPEYRLQEGDLIELYINDEFFPPEGAKPVQKAAPKKQPNQPKVTVIYEDENLAVLYKPTHLLCHSDRTGDANLVDAFTQYLTQKGEYDPHGENRFKPGICNRLDRGTEGLVIAAKNYAALRDMNELIRTDLLKKEYYTITVGIPQSGRFTAWWEHDEKNNKVSIHAHQSQDERRKQIITDVDVLRTAGPFALCKIGLVTGRTHQIRAHLAYLGKPVLGDIKYGNRKMNERTGTKTQALCAVRISFLDVPEENTLHYLSGKVIKLKDPQILQQFDALDKNKEAYQEDRCLLQLQAAACFLRYFLFCPVHARLGSQTVIFAPQGVFCPNTAVPPWAAAICCTTYRPRIWGAFSAGSAAFSAARTAAG